MFKKNVKLFVGFIIGGLLFGSIGVYATTQYLAKDIKFTPLNSEWNVDNVDDAINELYGTSTNIKYKSGVFNANTTTQKIDLGFKPKHLFMLTLVDGYSNRQVTYVYTEDISTNEVFVGWGVEGNYGYNKINMKTTYDMEMLEDGFQMNSNNVRGNGKTYYWAIG